MTAAAFPVADQVYACHECKPGENENPANFPLKFKTEEEYIEHILNMIRAKRGHLNCYQCKKPHRTLEGYIQHLQTVHNKEQKLICPGCDKEFPRVGGLIGHIETGACKGISKARMEAIRVEKVSGLRAGLKALEEQRRQQPGGAVQLGPGRVNEDYSQHFGIKGASVASKNIAGNNGSLPESINKSDVSHAPSSQVSAADSSGAPVLLMAAASKKSKGGSTSNYYHGDSKQPDLLTEDNLKSIGEPTENPWAHKKPLSPAPIPLGTTELPDVTSTTASQAAVWPAPPRQVRATPTLQTSAPKIVTPTLSADTIDPMDYYDPILRKYVCPHPRCGKSCPTRTGLLAHMRSPLHSKDQMQCPSCLRLFPGATALTQHVESQGTRCKVRDSDQYRIFVDQLTAGLTDVDGRHNDNTVRYVVPETDPSNKGATPEERQAALASNVQQASQQYIKKNFEQGKVKQKQIRW